MALTVTHSTVVAVADDGTSPVGSDEWNDDHTITGTVGPDVGARELLTGNRTYYFRTDGNNANTGLVDSSGGAFADPSFAYAYVCANLDLAGFTVTIKAGAEAGVKTWTDGVVINQPWTGGGAVTIEGDTATPTNRVISATSEHAFNISGSLPGILQIKGFQIETTTGGAGVNHGAVGSVYISDIEWAGTVDGDWTTAVSGGFIYETGAHTISGSSNLHCQTASPSSAFSDATVTLVGAIAYGNAFAVSAGNALFQCLATYDVSGATPTGARYYVDTGGQIQTFGAGANYFPGDSAGTADAATYGAYT
jgi:hypothetical protein